MLPVFVVGGSELGGLNLEGELDVEKLQNVRNVAEARKANLRKKQGLRYLSLTWNPNAYCHVEDCVDNDDIGELMKLLTEAVVVAAVNEDDRKSAEEAFDRHKTCSFCRSKAM